MPIPPFPLVYNHGRDAIEGLHAMMFATSFARSVQPFDALAVRGLDQSFASVEIHWSMTGATVLGWPATHATRPLSNAF